MKGQFSRTGSDRRPGFMGGDLPLILKLPKRGFVSPFKIRYRLVSVASLDAVFEAGAEATPETMVGKGLISTSRPAVKVLGEGEIRKPLKVSAHAFSRSALDKIAKAGGTCVITGQAGNRVKE
jgi:large subunit ribosomal protein L15